MTKATGLKSSVISHFRVDKPTCPAPDDHASTNPSSFKVGPIISCVDGSTDRITWFLSLIITQWINHIPAYLTNTQMFLERLRNASPNNAYVMESFDVTALYTNVSNDSAMQAIFELLVEHEGRINMHGLSIQQLIAVLKERLNSSILRWSGKYFVQIRGLAMGQRLAPSLAPSLAIVGPIISCVDGSTDRITWFLSLIITQWINHIPAYLTNTQMFLERLRNASPNNAYVMESFDVTALYTNVSNDSAMQAIFELLVEHEGRINMHGLSIQQLIAVLKERLNSSILRWSGKYFVQIRGLAMGQRLAPSLAPSLAIVTATTDFLLTSALIK
ncbi:unnamed protein product [Angiostrongylus costaricensis]|uniref:Reverse transcriptase domain-containing protein n=1 Tax=Angiostrongylus costaricensis TaxID=334426 RepID=A0A3P7ICQ7_ANGCS|nr:unnamed protein product [Angiostrongylus costaricensis]